MIDRQSSLWVTDRGSGEKNTIDVQKENHLAKHRRNPVIKPKSMINIISICIYIYTKIIIFLLLALVLVLLLYINIYNCIYQNGVKNKNTENEATNAN